MVGVWRPPPLGLLGSGARGRHFETAFGRQSRSNCVGLALAMVALSGVGVASMLSGANGVPVPLAGMLGADIHTAWLANKSAAGPRASSGASRAHGTQQRPHAAAAAVAKRRRTGTRRPPPTRTTARTTARGEGARANASAGMTEDGKVILNLASVEDLRHLPGVGAKRADAILALRARLGRFKQVNDLLRVKGIGVRGLKKIMPHVVLDAPKPVGLIAENAISEHGVTLAPAGCRERAARRYVCSGR